MMGVIKNLSDLTISQIAAGEVVASPANVVKELLENSLDAGSSKITVAIRKSGLELIAVTDNGVGIAKDDLPLAVKRHATSKLTSNDLVKLDYLGFRGEALAAIAAVSKVVITSRYREDPAGWKIEASSGNVSEPRPTAANRGTTVAVNNLFDNAPARRKFLRSEKTENYRIRYVFKMLALANPQVSFILEENGSQIFNLQASSREKRVREVMPKEFMDNCLAVFEQGPGIKLTGFISLPTYNRYEARHQHLFLNQRLITDRSLTRAVRSGYYDVLASDKHPVYCLFYEVDHNLVDVNVHPGKEEVRFVHPHQIYSLTIKAVQASLISASPKTSTEIAWQAASYMNKNKPSGTIIDPKQLLAKPSQAVLNLHSTRSRAEADQTVRSEKASYQTLPPKKVLDPAPEPCKFGLAKAQIQKSYIVAEKDDLLFLIDQHAAHERIVYERLKQQLHQGRVASQMLLLPLTVNLEDSISFDLLVEASQDLMKLGLEIEPFGGNCLLVRQVPSLLSEKNDWELILHSLAQELKDRGQADQQLTNKLDRCLAEIACHSSIKAGQELTKDEMQALLDQLAATENCSQCNHGRPTHVSLDSRQLAKLFQRR